MPEVRRDRDSYLLSDGQLATARELRLGEADWSACQMHGGHWCMCHGKPPSHAAVWSRKQKQNIGRAAPYRDNISLSLCPAQARIFCVSIQSPRTDGSAKAPSFERCPVETQRFQIIKVQAYPLGKSFQQLIIFTIKYWQLISGSSRSVLKHWLSPTSFSPIY